MQASAVKGQCHLADLAIVRLRGADAVAFLHGQLTNAVQGLSVDQARPAGYCSAQGRLLANGVIWSDGGDGIDFMVAHDLAGELLRRLRLFVLRSKVTIDLDDSRLVRGVWGGGGLPGALQGLPAWSRCDLDGATWIVAPFQPAAGPAAWCIGPAASAALSHDASVAGGDSKPAPPTAHDADDASGWEAARLAGGWPLIRGGARDIFLTGSLDMDLNGSIDFAKGCYPGQEVIARSHYRGVVKRRMAYGTVLWAPGAPALPPVADLYPAGEADSRPAGRVIESVIDQGVLHAAVEISLSDWPGMRYAVGAPDGPVLAIGTPRAQSEKP